MTDAQIHEIQVAQHNLAMAVRDVEIKSLREQLHAVNQMCDAKNALLRDGVLPFLLDLQERDFIEQVCDDALNLLVESLKKIPPK